MIAVLWFIAQYLFVGLILSMCIWVVGLVFMDDCSFYFEKRDLWIGAYWDYKAPLFILGGENNHTYPLKKTPASLDVYVCLVPLLPLRFHFEREQRP